SCPSLEIAAPLGLIVSPRRWPSPVRRSQTLIELSPLVEMTLSSLGKNTATIDSVCPVRVRRSSPVSTSQILTVLSLPPLASSLPLGENTLTHTSSSCPWRTARLVPVATSQIRRV